MSKRAEVKGAAAQRDLRTSPVVIIGIVVIAVLVVLVLMQVGRSSAARAPVPTLAASDVATGVTADGHYYRGSLEAKVLVVEYEDLRCPYCRQFFAETEPQMFEQYVKAGLVREESRLVPFLGPASQAAAEAAACAADQDKYWEFRHEAYANQKAESEPLGRADFTQWATAVGLDLAPFTNCFDTQKYKSRVEATMADAQRRGVNATPTFFVGEDMYQGAFPFTAEGDQTNFRSILEAALTSAAGVP